MAQVLKQKKRKPANSEVISMSPNSDLFDKARAELGHMKDQMRGIRTRKAIIIKDLADKLLNERGLQKRSISALIAKELKGYVSPKHVRKCLGEELKDDRKRRKKRKSANLGSQNDEDYPEAIWQINPEEYSIDDVDQYDVMLCREIVKYQHKEIQRLRGLMKK